MADDLIRATSFEDTLADKALRLECLKLAFKLELETLEAEYTAKKHDGYERRKTSASELAELARIFSAFVIGNQSDAG